MVRKIIDEFMTGLKILALGFNTPDETATMFTEQRTDHTGMRTPVTSTEGAFGIPDMVATRTQEDTDGSD